MGLLDSIFGGGTDTSNLRSGSKGAKKQLKKGIKQGTGAVEENYGKGIDSLAAGLKAAQPYYEDASNNFSPYMQSGLKGQQAYVDSLGLNGQEGYDNTVDQFHQGPGFQFALDAARTAFERGAANNGAWGSGNLLDQVVTDAQGRQNQEFGGWQDRLMGLGSQGLSAAGQQAGVLQNLGGMLNQGAINKAGIQTDMGSKLADIYTGGRSALATNQYNTGLGLQNQEMADNASQLSLISSILGGGAKIAGFGTA